MPNNQIINWEYIDDISALLMKESLKNSEKENQLSFDTEYFQCFLNYFDKVTIINKRMLQIRI